MKSRMYHITEVVRLTGLNRRAIRYYVEQGLISGAERRGSSMYSYENIIRLRTITYLRIQERLRLSGLKKRLARMTLAEMEALINPQTQRASPEAAPEEPSYRYVQWNYIELVPGLELRVRSDAGPLLRRLVQEIHSHYAATTVAPGPQREPQDKESHEEESDEME